MSDRVSRALLAGSGVALAVSLFLPWFDGVTGWEHWDWADVAFAVLGAALVVASLRPPRAAVLVPLAVLCGAGITVVLGHGFTPQDTRIDVPTVVPLLALGALLAGVVGALAPWPRAGGTALLVAAAAGVVWSLFGRWGIEGDTLVVFGGLDRLDDPEPTGWQHFAALDVALVLLAAGLLAAAALGPRVPRALWLALGAATVLALACVAVAWATRTGAWIDEARGTAAASEPRGATQALLALTAALAGLALLRPRGRSGRAG